MKDIAKRFTENPLLSPGDLKASSDGLEITCLLNPGVFKYQDKTRTDKKVDVSITVENTTATIYISDTGIGILGSHIGEIFNLFYRANSQEVGSGFGLYNVKSALLKLNGQIEVNSVMHQGTTFKVTIPSI